MLADIASGNTGTADVLFLIAAILFALAALVAFLIHPDGWRSALTPAGLCLVAIGWLVL